MIDPIDPIDELVARSKDHPELRKFHKFHKANKEVLAFLVSEMRLRIDNGFRAGSFHDLCGYCRWKLQLQRGPGERFALNDHLCSWYGRAIVILYPQFNGMAELRRSTADDAFGTRIEPVSRTRTRRQLEWSDGTPIEKGWRPKTSHPVARPANLRPDIHPRGQ